MSSLTDASGFVQLQAGEVSVSKLFVILFTLFVFGLPLKKWLDEQQNPLSRFPGPFWAKYSNFSHSRRFMSGRQPYSMLELHNKYGPVVRVAPNELSFNTASSWRDIYGPRKGHQTFIKSDFYDGGSFAAEAHSIVSERDPAAHKDMTKYLGNAFSDRSLKAQEHLVAEGVDEFVQQIGEKGKEKNGINIVMWFNLATFDIIGSLAFGKNFGGVAKGTEHFWVSIVVKALDTRKHEAYSMDLVQKRINSQIDRPDFISRILDSRDQYSISDVQIAAHASDFVIAGSETTATALSCITYYLLKNPDILRRLQDEVRSTFKSYDEIDNASTIGLKYLNAICLEGMRVYPPLPFPLPRVVPAGGDTIDGHFVPEGTIVSTNPTASSMSEANFKNAWKFIPERWMGENKDDVLDASQPFSYGTRSCMGRSLGWMELRTFLAKIHFKYDLEMLDKDLDWHGQSEMHTLWKKPELNVRVRPRAM